jgi:hypothetical protein
MRGGRNLGGRIGDRALEISMTSEPDSASRRRPPTIDLKATEIETQAQAEKAGGTQSAESAAEPTSSSQGSSGQGSSGQGSATSVGNSPSRPTVRRVVGAAAGAAVVAAAILVGLYFAGVNPLPTATRPAPTSVTSNMASNATAKISSQLDRIEGELQSQPAEPTLATRLAKVEVQTKTVSDSLAAVNQRLDSIAAAAQGAREHADEASAAAKGATRNAVQPGDLDALASRIAALERSIKSLSQTTVRRATPTDDRAARGAVATEALRAAVERGAPFTAELAAVKSFGADRGVAELEPFAATGIPSAGDLGRELSQLTNSLRQASGSKPADASFLGRLEDNARNLVRVTPIDAPPGNEPAAVISRLDADAQHADIAAALADIARLPPAAKAMVQPWVQKVNARNAAIAASRRIAAGALAALANAKTQ